MKEIKKVRSYLVIVSLFLFMVGVSTLTALAQELTEFKADFTTVEAKGKIISGTIYIKGDKIRQEVEEDGGTLVTILRLDRKVSWILMPDNKYMEVSLPFDPNQPQNQDFEMATIGQEKINGYDCDIIQYTYKKKSLGVLKQWVAKELKYAIKIESLDSKGKVTSTTEYKNISRGILDDSLFELPKGYSKFSLFGK
ncbi:MAG TPA: hypothetical protein DEB05_06350 [Firmicutes bacterium]|jgi:outer membrane lipoprotein-sorting protein|nr:hypothetical protein [Bacillota bacterium]HBT16561.1 hypothetical protein [Bacillota bacterium]